MLKNILHPNRYHGFTATPPYFEGWYYKLVSEDENSRFAIIPGVYIAPDQKNSHSFIQVFNSEAKAVQFHRYPYQSFQATPDSFEVKIGQNRFTADQIDLSINDDIGQLSGTLNFERLNPWPIRLFSPGAMGWFAWMPFMETYHGVVSMDHFIKGTLTSNGVLHDFTGGRGYIEKDWGKQFPSAYIWGQSNHFDQMGVSLMVSVAVIPWLGREFAGFIICLLYKGHLYRFTTYNLSKIVTLTVKDTDFNLVVQNSKYRLTLKGLIMDGVNLKAPTFVSMNREINETLNASIDVRLTDKNGGVIYEGQGRHAGLETVGDLEHLIGMIQKP